MYHIILIKQKTKVLLICVKLYAHNYQHAFIYIQREAIQKSVFFTLTHFHAYKPFKTKILN